MIDWIVSILQSLNDTTLAGAVRDSIWLFPAIETIHVIAIVFVVGSIARIDMRLMGLISRDRPVTEVADELLPYTWISFAVATIFGLLLWSSKPLTYLGIAFFNVKMGLILLAGLNMLYFQFVTFRTVAQWDRDPIPPVNARLSGSISIAFWVSVVVCGRFIGFV